MANFIAEAIGQEKADEGVVVTVRLTGVGGSDGPMMTRAKGKALTVTNFGRDTASMERTTDIEGSIFDKKEEIFADKSEGLFTGPLSGVKDRLQAFRRDGLFAEVKSVKELKTKRLFSEEDLDEQFGVLADVVDTFEYEILVTTKYSFG